MREAEDRLLSIQDLAVYLGVPVETIYRWRTKGVGPAAARVGRHLRWRKVVVDRWLAEREALSATH